MARKGNINDDPRFEVSGIFDFSSFVNIEIGGVRHAIPDFVIDPGDYRLAQGSPCVDSGTREYVPFPQTRNLEAPLTDAEGSARPCGADIDMGMFESCELDHFLRGDCNADGQVEGQIGDAVFLLVYNFLGGEKPSCLSACDADGDGSVEGQPTDAIYLLTFNFLGGASPPEPFPLCGPANLPSDEILGCETSPPACR